MKLLLDCTKEKELFTEHYNWHKIYRVEIAGEYKMLFSELKCKEVICERTCKKLGRVTDFEFDECSGQIKKLIITSCSMFSLCFHPEPDCEIWYKDIKQIGPDIILIERC